MKKIYLKLSAIYEGYTVPDDFRNNHNELYTLSMALELYEYDWIRILQIPNKNILLIYSEESFKEQVELEFETEKEEDVFEDAYIAYRNKREKEIPEVELSFEDWEILKHKWEQITKEKPGYVVFELDDSGLLDKVDVYGKGELSQEDVNYIKQEHEKYLKYEKARQKYIQNHPDYSEVWRGPQDDEYEADIMKYYDKD
tara:strand:+ start:48 stop:644 length:597 start_codon:yes stop_codon:yes gene_type:complete